MFKLVAEQLLALAPISQLQAQSESDYQVDSASRMTVMKILKKK